MGRLAGSCTSPFCSIQTTCVGASPKLDASFWECVNCPRRRAEGRVEIRVCREWKSWHREVVRVALSSGLGEGFLARRWAGSGKPRGGILLSHSSAEKMNVSRSL